MSLSLPVRYTPGVEDIQPGEQDTIQDLNEAFDTILETTAKVDGHHSGLLLEVGGQRSPDLVGRRLVSDLHEQ